MAALQYHELTYPADSSTLLEPLRALGSPVYLDSARPHSDRGRFDILAAGPLERFIVEPKEIVNLSDTKAYGDYLNHFQQLARCLESVLSPVQAAPDIPFCGGAIGYAGYDMGRECVAIPDSGKEDIGVPVMAVGIYGWAIVVDHHRRRCHLVAHPATPAGTVDEVLERLRDCPPASAVAPQSRGALSANLDAAAYLERFDRVQRYIRDGDCYQINLARRFSAPFPGNPWAAYRQLRAVAAAPFSAYIELGDAAVLSLSPERFLQLRQGLVRTEPIKGTAPRSPLPERDRELAQSLLDSEKNRAENLMIVDLLRNDLGRVCRPGSIHVEKLFELQSFNTVHHLVSTVRGELREGLTGMDLLAACFPGGSITGAPKKRAMEIIEELEPHRRSVYCGSVFHLGADGSLDSNIAIRTLVCRDRQLYCWSGGGIVADSVADDEFEETWNKVGMLLEHLMEHTQE